jgi:hypothetical protein
MEHPHAPAPRSFVSFRDLGVSRRATMSAREPSRIRTNHSGRLPTLGGLLDDRGRGGRELNARDLGPHNDASSTGPVAA